MVSFTARTKGYKIPAGCWKIDSKYGSPDPCWGPRLTSALCPTMLIMRPSLLTDPALTARSLCTRASSAAHADLVMALANAQGKRAPGEAATDTKEGARVATVP